MSTSDVESKATETPKTELSFSSSETQLGTPITILKPKWYRSSYYNAVVLGLCNFFAPGIWGAMNSLGGGGQQDPYLVNSANAITFCLMILSSLISPFLIRHIGIRPSLFLGMVGYAPWTAGLYTNNRFGTTWLVLFGAALCGMGSGVLWTVSASIALSYSEPQKQGRFIAIWITMGVVGQVLGGAVNLALNARDGEKGKVSYSVYLAFIGMTALAPFMAFLLTPPEKVQRTDGVMVKLAMTAGAKEEMKANLKIFLSQNFLLLLPLVAQGMYLEAIMFTFESLWFSVRARALGSFLSGIVGIIAGNVLGAWLDSEGINLRVKARGAYVVILGVQGVLWVWTTVLVTRYRRERPSFDWVDGAGFANGFSLFLLLVGCFQVQFMYLFFVSGELASTNVDVIRVSGLLRAVESVAQALSYGLNAIPVFADVGGVYLNFGLWAFALIPGWLLVRQIGVSLKSRKFELEGSSGDVDVRGIDEA